MNKRILIVAGLVLLFFVNFRHQERVAVRPKASVRKKEVLTSNLPDPRWVDQTRTPATDSPSPVEKKKKLLRIYKSKRETIPPPHVISRDLGLADGLVFAEDVSAVKEKDYAPALGPMIQEKNGLVFFRSSSSSGYPVVYDPANASYYPVNSVLKIENVGAELRARFRTQFEEHYYHEGLRTLYIESSPSQVIATYTELRQQGLKVSLEINRAYPRPR